ncbi:MAG: DUF3592 domain-containing protein [Caulobacterales bacterium]|nr:DUF3592 domain-containing protein [Caulobacterales bacterium]
METFFVVIVRFLGIIAVGAGGLAIAWVAWDLLRSLAFLRWRTVKAGVVSSTTERRTDGSFALRVKYDYPSAREFRWGEYLRIAAPSDLPRRLALIALADRIRASRHLRLLVNPDDPADVRLGPSHPKRQLIHAGLGGALIAGGLLATTPAPSAEPGAARQAAIADAPRTP